MAKLTGTSGTISVNGVKLGDVVSWEAETKPTPVADIETVRWHAEEVQLNTEINRLLVGVPQTEDLMPLLYPLVCDLSSDPLCCAILKQLARHPWEPTHRCALLDRMEELGYDDRRPMAEYALAGEQQLMGNFAVPAQSWPRRGRRWLINRRRRILQAAFGPFEGSTPEVVPGGHSREGG